MSQGEPTGTESLTSIAVSPHPHLLGVLGGDVKFQPPQCIAGLVDNAFGSRTTGVE